MKASFVSMPIRSWAIHLGSHRKIPHLLGVFYSWLDDRGLNVADLTSFGAEEFQT